MESKVNWARVLLGGLGAGLVFNLTFLWPGLRLTHLLRAMPRNDAGIFAMVTVVLTFLLTILMISLYAVIRGQLKSGPKAAAAVGASLGLMMAVLQYLGWRLALGRAPGRMWFLNALVGFVMIVIASLVGAWIYEKPSA